MGRTKEEVIASHTGRDFEHVKSATQIKSLTGFKYDQMNNSDFSHE